MLIPKKLKPQSRSPFGRTLRGESRRSNGVIINQAHL